MSGCKRSIVRFTHKEKQATRAGYYEFPWWKQRSNESTWLQMRCELLTRFYLFITLCTHRFVAFFPLSSFGCFSRLCLGSAFQGLSTLNYNYEPCSQSEQESVCVCVWRGERKKSLNHFSFFCIETERIGCRMLNLLEFFVFLLLIFRFIFRVLCFQKCSLLTQIKCLRQAVNKLFPPSRHCVCSPHGD